MEKYEHCTSNYSYSSGDYTFGKAKVLITDDNIIQIYHEDEDTKEEWVGSIDKQDAYLLVCGNQLHATLKRISENQLEGTWADQGESGNWKITLIK